MLSKSTQSLAFGWGAIFSFAALFTGSTSVPLDEDDSVRSTTCMADLIKLSGVSNQSAILHVLHSEGVDEAMLAELDYATADTLLKTYGLRLAVQRNRILKCVNPSLKSSPRSPCFNYGGPCGHGVCSLLQDGELYEYSCDCDEGFGGIRCQRELNECELRQPCKHGATCEDRVNNYTCHCVPGYYGKHCETDRNECASAPCLHGNCIDVVNGYRCDCHAGYTGTLCETDIDDCAPNPCFHGNCKDGVNSYTCRCQPGYTGPRCEKDINECSSSPCKNFATCHDQVNGYMCQCFHGYNGVNCENEWLNETMFKQFAENIHSARAAAGPVYTRWGRTSCPSSAQLVYDGFVAGPHYTHKGGGSTPLCLPKQPIYGRHSDHTWGDILYDAEYQLPKEAPFSKSQFHNREIPCAVCMAAGKIELFMLPARNVCPSGWVREYHGYLMSEHYTHHRTQHVCMDDDIEIFPGSAADQNGILFYPVAKNCDSGRTCPPYINARELTCSVCSK